MSAGDVAISVGQGVIGYYLGALGATLVLLARDFGVDVLSLGWLSNGFGVSSVLLGAVGAWVLRVGPANLLRVVVVVLGAGGALLAVAPGLAPAQLGAVLLGVGGAGVVLSTPAMIVGERVPQRLTIVSAASSVAGVLAPLLLGAFEVLVGNGRLALLLPIPAVVFVVLWPFDGPQLEAAGRIPTERLARLARGWLGMVLGIAAEFGFVLWGAARLIEVGLSEAQAAAGAAAFPVGMAVARLVGARSAAHRLALGTACLATMAGAVLLALPGDRWLVIVVGLTVGGMGAAFMYPLTLASLVASAQLPTRAVAPVATTASGAAVLLGPALFRYVAGLGGLRTGFLVLVPLALAVMLVVPRRVEARTESVLTP